MDTFTLHNLSCEPMDIDVSGHSVKEMDISDNDNDTLEVKTFLKTEKSDVRSKADELINNRTMAEGNHTVKKYHINMRKARRNPTKSYKYILFQILCGGIIVLVAILTMYIFNLKCYDDFNVEVLKDNLSNKLLGQREAVNVIMNTLELKDRSKLLFFSGGTGVGKTLASSVLLDTIGPCSNVYHYTMPSFTSTFSTEFMLGLTMCKMSLIIVDDLTANDMHVKSQIKEVMEKSEHLRKDITVILIYNCHESTKDFTKKCDESFRKRLLENFSDIKALKVFVKFKHLSETHLRECIKQELGNRNLDEKQFEDILKIFNVTVDGCKGVHSKIKYLNIL